MMTQFDHAIATITTGHLDEPFRVCAWGIIPAGVDDYADLNTALPEPMRRDDGMGVAWLASRFKSCTIVTSIDRVQPFLEAARDGRDTNGFDVSDCNAVDGWLTYGGWDRHNPTPESGASWCNGNEGILVDTGDDGVVVYETHYTWMRHGEPVETAPIATWHCTICHADGEGQQHVYSGPVSRRAIGWKAGLHMEKARRDGHDLDPWQITMHEAVAQYATERIGRQVNARELMTCQPCADIARLRGQH